jgi:hypothetical protein
MSDYPQRKPAGHECPPAPENPADQPKPPGKDCKDLPDTTPPEWKPPDKCVPDPECNCPSQPPSSGPDCLQNLIDAETAAITAAERAKAFKAELEAFLAKAKAAAQEYNRAKYDKLLKQWQDQDRDIAELIRKLVCALPCWRCVIECYICPLIYDLRDSEQRLYDGDWKDYYSDYKAHNLYDLRYWLDRDRDFKTQTWQRIKNVLAAWEKPAQTIEKNLADDAKLISDCNKALGTDPSTVVFDVFFKLVPMHLAIAPPATSDELKTQIDKKFTEFCDCDKDDPDNCCGPDVGKLSWRQRLIGPQPYLVDPNFYFDIICCLVEKRYLPAKDLVAKAEAAYQKTDNEIQRRKAQIDNALKTFEKDAKGAIPGDIDCCDYEKKDGEEPAQKSAARR